VITAHSAQQIPNFTSNVITHTKTILISTTMYRKKKERRKRKKKKKEKKKEREKEKKRKRK